jgi:hypothetical protein
MHPVKIAFTVPGRAIGLFLLAACFLALTQQAVLAYDVTLTDPTGDDYGPGTYAYPLDAVFTAGSFDITRLTVSEAGSKVRFEIEIAGELTDPWGSGAGFSLQSIDIYIDKDGVAGSGATWGLTRRNVEFSPSSAWEYCVWCAPPFDDFETHVVDQNGNTYYSGVSALVDQTDDVITIDVPKSTIGTPSAAWNYVVLMLSQSGYDSGRVRAVNADVGQWVLGGGDDGQWDSNVIDLVAGPGVPQQAVLANWSASTGVRAIVINRVDAATPEIIHTPPASWEAHVPLEVAAQITDDVVVAASVYARAPGGAYEEFEMERTTASAWSAAIPGSAIEAEGLEYYIWASDGTNESAYPGPASPFEVTVTGDITPPVISGLDAEPPVFSPNQDGYRDSALIVAELSEPCRVWLDVRDSLGTPVRSLADSFYCESGFSVAWDGKNQAGANVPDGRYTAVATCLDLAGLAGQPESTVVEVDIDQPLRRLDIVLLFHANQNVVPYGRVANLACYKGVLQTLRGHPSLKFMIHFSGTLISDLLWFDPETLDILRAGIADGQFEIVGSTYAQNIMYSTRVSSGDYEMNRHQIEIHRALIESVLGASPVSFWNPERVWTANFARLLADNGYTNVQVEDHILEDSGITGSEYLVRTTTYDGRTVNVFDDDKTFEGAINGAIDSGDTSGVMSFLRYLYSVDTDDQYAVCYHEDMEATGLWDYESGENPQVDFSNLNRLLTAFERDPRIKVTTYSEFLETHPVAEDVSPIVDGAASWMGGDAWFAEDAAAQAQAYRAMFDAVRDSINSVHSTFAAHAPDTVAARALIDHAWFTLCAHQYEFAVHGYGYIAGTTQWDLVRDALVAARAARYALVGAPVAPRAEDINGDTIEEIVAVTSGDLFVLSPYGGRLLYWFDLEDGSELVGNENFFRSYSEAYTNGNAYVPAATGCEAYTGLCSNTILPEVHQWTFEARRHCLNDSIWVDGVARKDLVNTLLAYDLDTARVEFEYDLGEVSVTKRIRPALHSLSAEYVFTSSSSAAAVDIEIENGLSPDCLGVMLTGGEALKYWDGEDTSSVFSEGMCGVVNVVAGKGLILDFAGEPAEVSGEEDVFGLEVNPRWRLDIPAYGSGSVTLRLGMQAFSGVTPGDGFKFRGQLLILPNPSRGSVDVYLRNPLAGDLSAQVFDARGRRVRSVTRAAAPGAHGGDPLGFISWDGLDEGGRPVASGVYTVQVTCGGATSTGKVALVR